jgi:hypothetical protein
VSVVVAVSVFEYPFGPVTVTLPAVPLTALIATLRLPVDGLVLSLHADVTNSPAAAITRHAKR